MKNERNETNILSELEDHSHRRQPSMLHLHIHFKTDARDSSAAPALGLKLILKPLSLCTTSKSQFDGYS